MKRILITGANSYIGTSFEKWLNQFPNEYSTDTLDMLDKDWKNKDFSSFDSIFHVAAIVHQNEKNVDPGLYFKVNTDLPLEVAKKAKSEGVRQFIFLSSMSVYDENDLNITLATKENPKTYYGKSKLEAERGLQNLENTEFRIAIVRPPMVYGPKSKGNYARLSKFSKLIPIFPNIENKRSMIFIDNLMEFIRNTLDYNLSGIYFPQNKEYVTTIDLVSNIRSIHDKRTIKISFLNFLIKKFFFITPIKKLFSDLTYDQKISTYDFDYQVVEFEKSIVFSELK